MRATNIVVGVVSALWFAMFWLGRDLVHGVYQQGAGIAPNAGQVDYYVVYPLASVALLLAAAWLGNIWRKQLIVLIPSLLLGVALLPYLLAFTGGM